MSKINRKCYRKCDFQAFDWLKFTLTTDLRLTTFCEIDHRSLPCEECCTTAILRFTVRLQFCNLTTTFPCRKAFLLAIWWCDWQSRGLHPVISWNLDDSSHVHSWGQKITAQYSRWSSLYTYTHENYVWMRFTKSCKSKISRKCEFQPIKSLEITLTITLTINLRLTTFCEIDPWYVGG
jgi:hypothetical protein